MTSQTEFTGMFDQSRDHLRAAAYRMLGSLEDADDAVQETWVRASQAEMDGISNVTGWLTTIVSRISLDMLRARRRRSETLTDIPEAASNSPQPEQEALLAESVGLAMLVVLDNLSPAERVAFVLHDVFAVPFEQIAEITDRSAVAAKKLASRARGRVRGAPTASFADLAKQRPVVEAFLTAARSGDLEQLLAVLDPEVVRTADGAALAPGVPAVVRGARAVAEETSGNRERARFARVILIDGVIGAVVAPSGRLQLVLRIATDGERVTGLDIIADPSRLRTITLSLADPMARSDGSEPAQA